MTPADGRPYESRYFELYLLRLFRVVDTVERGMLVLILAAGLPI